MENITNVNFTILHMYPTYISFALQRSKRKTDEWGWANSPSDLKISKLLINECLMKFYGEILMKFYNFT